MLLLSFSRVVIEDVNSSRRLPTATASYELAGLDSFGPRLIFRQLHVRFDSTLVWSGPIGFYFSRCACLA